MQGRANPQNGRRKPYDELTLEFDEKAFVGICGLVTAVLIGIECTSIVLCVGKARARDGQERIRADLMGVPCGRDQEQA